HGEGLYFGPARTRTPARASNNGMSPAGRASVKIAKIFGITLAALVALLIVAVAVVATVFDPNDYKDEVAALVESRTGRSLALDGDLELSYFPWLAVTTRNVTLGNAPGFGPEPFASIERAAVRVKLMPLFERRVEVGTIELDGLVLN